MTQAYDDSLDSFKYEEDKNALPKPHVKIIVDGQSIFMPGMKTYFVNEFQDAGTVVSGTPGKGLYVVGGTYCSCDTVMVGSRRISGVPDKSNTGTRSGADTGSGSSSGGGTICSCDTVDTCSSNCGCVAYTSGSGGGGSVSCGSPCACVPVH